MVAPTQTDFGPWTQPPSCSRHVRFATATQSKRDCTGDSGTSFTTATAGIHARLACPVSSQSTEKFGLLLSPQTPITLIIGDPTFQRFCVLWNLSRCVIRVWAWHGLKYAWPCRRFHIQPLPPSFCAYGTHSMASQRPIYFRRICLPDHCLRHRLRSHTFSCCRLHSRH